MTWPGRRATAAANRNERYFTTPARAGILIGASAAVYAVSLAAVAGLQASDDAALATRRQPYVDAVADGRAANDALEAAIGDAGLQARSLASDYSTSADELAAYEVRLDAWLPWSRRPKGRWLPCRSGSSCRT